MITYRGARGSGLASVWKCEKGQEPKKLDMTLSLALRNHAPGGFNWGYSGAGPAQLALALLLDVTCEGGLASKHYQAFKEQFVSHWAGQWEMTRGDIETWVDEQEGVA